MHILRHTYKHKYILAAPDLLYTLRQTHTHIYTHTYIYIYTYVCVCMHTPWGILQ